jgi:hypothetical protein
LDLCRPRAEYALFRPDRKRLLAKLLRGSHLSLVLYEHYEEDGAIVFREALSARL